MPEGDKRLAQRRGRSSRRSIKASNPRVHDVAAHGHMAFALTRFWHTTQFDFCRFVKMEELT